MTMVVALSVYNWNLNSKIKVSDLMLVLEQGYEELHERNNNVTINCHTTVENNVNYYRLLMELELFVQNLVLRKYKDNENLWLVVHDTMINMLPCLVLEVSDYNKYYLILKSE